MITVKNVTRDIDIPVKLITFPGGERHVQMPTLFDLFWARDKFEITLNFTGSDDLIDLMLVRDALPHRHEVSLYMPYVPFARQDRRVNPGEAHSLKVLARLINSLDFSKVRVVDPHSDVTEALIDNLIIMSQTQAFDHADNYQRVYHYVVAPDIGAAKKAGKIAVELGEELLQVTKHRDLQTGKILGMELLDGGRGSQRYEGYNILVVDDICDRGGTFLGLADLFPAEANLYLYVTHGIFSAKDGVDSLLQKYRGIICYNNMNPNIKFTNYYIGA